MKLIISEMFVFQGIAMLLLAEALLSNEVSYQLHSSDTYE
jgi:hypothetical protein